MTQAWSAAVSVPHGEAPDDGAMSAASRAVAARAGAYVGIKTCVEWTTALGLLVLTAPVMAGLAILLKCTSEGPVLYSQTRLGRGGRAYRMYKLRTMTHGCEAATGPVWSVRDDPRVTRIGRWLRDTHADELPQLWNVLRGEMSLIGPRPERPEIAAVIERMLPDFKLRLRVRPGITGLAQVQLPPDSDLHAVRYKLSGDLQYIEELGPGLDARIALATVCHFVGQLATATSHRLVRSFTPPREAAGQEMEPDYTLSMAGRSAGARCVAPKEELSRAA